MSFKLRKGDLPKGIFVCHSCDTPSCVNPDHLFAGTQADNVLDMWSKNRQYKYNNSAKGSKNGAVLHPEKLSRGENHPATTLLESDVRCIKASVGSYASIARKYAVSPETISNIIRGKTWGHVT
jgi:hypothetical protein